jgi:hypothetical protein
VLESLPAPSAASTYFAKLTSTGPGPGRGGSGNMTGLLARNAARLSINGGRYKIGNGQQQVVYSHTSTTALHSGSHLSGKDNRLQAQRNRAQTREIEEAIAAIGISRKASDKPDPPPPPLTGNLNFAGSVPQWQLIGDAQCNQTLWIELRGLGDIGAQGNDGVRGLDVHLSVGGDGNLARDAA